MWLTTFVLTILSVALTTLSLRSSSKSSLLRFCNNICRKIVVHKDTPSTEPLSAFLRLPPEIRLQIYRHALPQRQTIRLVHSCDLGCMIPKIPRHPSRTIAVLLGTIELLLKLCNNKCTCQKNLAPSFPPLLQVSYLLRQEAQQIFYGTNSFVLNIDTIKALHRSPELLGILRHGRMDGGDIFELFKDFRIRIRNNVMVDICGPVTRWKKYGGRVLVASRPSDVITGMLRDEENIPARVGQVLKEIDKKGDLTVGAVGKILDEIFWNWQDRSEATAES